MAADFIVQPRALAGRTYRLANQGHEGYLKAQDEPDIDGDRGVFVQVGINNSNKLRWRVEDAGNGRVRLRNVEFGGYLKAADPERGPDNDGDVRAWITRPNGHAGERDQWQVIEMPNGFFKFMNGHWGGPLKCGDGLDNDDPPDYYAWVNHRAGYSSMGKELWQLLQA